MRTIVVFYAWQSDRPNNVNRGFIERALEDAVKHFNANSKDAQITIDQDTQGVSGMPPVSQTILEKIADCDIFLPDLTFVARFEEGDKKGQLTPNPNVLIEFGHALSKKGHGFLMPVMNTAFGGPAGLPFDMGHLRNPILYRADPADNDEKRRTERNRLSRELFKALQITVDALPDSSQPEPSRVTSEIKAWASSQHTTRMGAIYQIAPVQLISGPKIFISISPASAFDESKEIDFALVRGQAQKFVPFSFQHWLDRPDAHNWLFHDPPSRGGGFIFPGRFRAQVGQSMWFVELSRYGIIELVSMIDTIGLPEDRGPIAIDGTQLEALAVNTIDNLATALQAVGVGGPAVLSVTLLEVDGCILIRGRRDARFQRQPIVLPEATLESFEPPLANQLRRVLDAIWRAGGVPEGSGAFGTGTWDGYKRK
jgi:hypothetical protein